jgi:RHS repeat-associated protein
LWKAENLIRVSLTYVSFSDGSNAYGYGYDSSNVWGTPVNNPKGRMVLANHATQGAALFSYDTGGRLINTWQCTPINCGTSSYPLSYTYNYVNQPQATTDAAGNTFTKAYNAAGEVTSLQSSKTGTHYPQYLLNNISYNAFGEVVTATYGDGIVRTNTYDKMGRPTEIQDGATSSPTYRLYLTYYGNGNVKTFNDTVSGGYTFTYDAFHRLVSSTNTAQSYSWTYDQFGNRWHQDKTAGSGYTVDLSFDSNNHINTGGYSYDAAGNLLKDGSACNPCWQYDDNGNLVSSSYGSSAATYVYDALGRRVEKVSGGITFDFVLDGSNPLDEYQGSVWPTVWSRTNGGVFTYANGTTYFNRTDNIGTPRVSTDYTGAVKRTETMGPFGDGFTESYAGLDFTGFAGGVWDQENNGDHFGAREYAKTQGRWLTPDPAGLAAVNPSNPQTWNRYAYVTDNPVSFTDPKGLYIVDCVWEFCSPCPNCGSGGGDGGGGGSPDYTVSTPPPGASIVAPTQQLQDAMNQAESRFNTIWSTGCDPVTGICGSTKYWFNGGDGSVLEQQKELAAIQLGQAACGGQDPSAVAGCIQDAYDTLYLKTPDGAQSPLVGGNYNFDYTRVVIPGADISANGLGCTWGRCGIFDSLHFHSDGTFHVDTGNPFFFPIGSLAHLGWDFIGGNTVWSGGIPRPWWQK